MLDVDVQLAVIDSSEGNQVAAIARCQAILGRLAPGPIQTSALSALAGAQFEHGDFATSEATYTRLLALRRETYGEHSNDVARTYLDLAYAQQQQGKLDEAIASYRAAAAIARSVLGGTHPEVATIEIGLANSLRQSGRDAEARAAVTDAIAIERGSAGHDLDLADALAVVADLEQDARHWPLARAALEECYAIRKRVLDPGDYELRLAEAALAKLYKVMHVHARTTRQ